MTFSQATHLSVNNLPALVGVCVGSKELGPIENSMYSRCLWKTICGTNSYIQSQGRMKGPEILFQKNLIKQGTFSLQRKDAVGDRWDGVFNYQIQMCGRAIFFFLSGWPQVLDLGPGERFSLRMRMSLTSTSNVFDDGVCYSPR